MSKKKKSKSKKAGSIGQCTHIVYTDGGCAFNPGGPGGCGVVIIDQNTGEVTEMSQGYISTTNNRMEIMAAVIALENIHAGAVVMLYSDSQYLVKTLLGIFSKKTNDDLWSRLDTAISGKTVFSEWVRGHNGNDFNERCDDLATEAMSGGDLLPDKGYTGGLRQLKKAGSRQTKNIGGAMGVRIEIPEGANEYFDPSESCKYWINPECAAEIRALNNKKKLSFKDYKNLKTGGLDGWSRVPLNTLKELCGDTVTQYVCEQFSDEKSSASALKWYCRGLSLRNAVRRVLVDEEISENALRAGHTSYR